MSKFQDGYFLEDMLKVTTRHQGSWFSPGSTRWFNTHYAKTCYLSTDNRIFFVTSERFDGFGRFWSVRVCELDGEINTVGEFQGYNTRAAAHAAAKNSAGAAWHSGAQTALEDLREKGMVR